MGRWYRLCSLTKRNRPGLPSEPMKTCERLRATLIREMEAFVMKGIGYETPPPVTYFSGSCRAGPQEVLILRPEQLRRRPLLSRLAAAFGKSIRFLMGSRE